jgi:hypothetical protein
MSDPSTGGGDVTQQEREMEEHERKAQAHDPSERSPKGAGDTGVRPIEPDSRAADPAGPDPAEGDPALDDDRSGRPGPPGNIDIGGGVTGGS